MASREEMIKTLWKTYPKLFVSITEKFDRNDKGGIWIMAEGGEKDSEGLELFDYYAEDPQENFYIFGVRKHLHYWAEEKGWGFEWYDAGTIMLYQNQ